MMKLVAFLGGVFLNGACARPQGVPTEASASAAAAAPSPAQQVERNLEALGNAARDYFEKHQGFPTDQTRLIPAIDCCTQNFAGKGQCAPAPELFGGEPWTTLGYRPEGAQSFQYQYTGVANAASFVIIAHGNLDCDDVTITYTLTGDVLNGKALIQLARPEPGTD